MHVCHVFSAVSKFAFVYHISSNLGDSRLKRYGDISIFKMVTPQFWIFVICRIWSPDPLRMREILSAHSEFHLNWTTCSWIIAKKWFSMRSPSAILNLPISWFFVVSVAICVCIQNFVIFGRFAAEIWSYNDFQNGGRPPCWIFEIWHFHHLKPSFACVYASELQISS